VLCGACLGGLLVAAPVEGPVTALPPGTYRIVGDDGVPVATLTVRREAPTRVLLPPGRHRILDAQGGRSRNRRR
jgi:hypothetical protein